jgi:farnesol dehydrogenase
MAASVAMAPRDREAVRRVNLGGLRNVVRAASYGSIDRILYTSTVLALGSTEGETGDEEREPQSPVPANAYLATKAEALVYAREQISQGAPIVVVYPGIVYGPGPDREAGIMTRMLADLVAGKLPALIGPGDRRWCHAFTLDVARGHRLAFEKGAPGRGYVLGGENATLAEWLGIASLLSGARIPRLRLPYAAARLLAAAEVAAARLAGRPPRLSPDAVDVFRREWAFRSDRALAELGYAITPLEEGIRRTLAGLPGARA